MNDVRSYFEVFLVFTVRVNPGPQALFPSAKILADERPGGASAAEKCCDVGQGSERRKSRPVCSYSSIVRASAISGLIAP